MDTKQIERDSKLRAAKENELIKKNRQKRRAKAAFKKQVKEKNHAIASAKHDIIKWIDKDRGNLYYGQHNEKLLFSIKKSLIQYTLTVLDKNFINDKKDQGFKVSPQLQNLKDKAKKLLLKYLKQASLKVPQKEA
jgi:hypothetical protein